MQRRQPNDAYRPFPNVEARNILQTAVEVPLLLRLMEVPEGVRILEVGCGRGVALPALVALRRPRQLVGVDTDPELLAVARHAIARDRLPAEVVRADVRSLPFADRSFDVVIDFGTCYHIPQSEHAVAEIERVLAPGGRFVTETRASQALAHPIRTSGRGLPWRAAPRLERTLRAVLWSCQVKRGAGIA
jgi:SAM-dependent methyltransferase